MKCQRCHKSNATTQLVQQVSGQLPQTLYICDTCAKALGIHVGALSQSQAFTPNPFTMMAQLFDSSLGFGGPGAVQKAHACEKCQMTFDEFKKNGLFGCPSCYEAFSDGIDPVFCRFQMGNSHIGRSLGLDSDGQQPEKEEVFFKAKACDEDVASIEQRHTKRQLAEKKMAMAAAVEKEDYQKAAGLRDEIRQMEETEGEKKA